MIPFRFCPACGTEMHAPTVEEGSRCPGCGRTWYRNPAPAASAVIVDGDRALVVERGIDPGKGKFDSPGGFLHEGEDLLEGLKREIREELGVEIRVTEEDFLGAEAHRYGDDGRWLLSLGFRARIESGRPDPADDVAAIRWVTADEVEELDFQWEHNREQTRRALRAT